jgi:DNA-directed RNA polymerase specialized sigma24 family protein
MPDPTRHDLGEAWDASDVRALHHYLAEGLTQAQIGHLLGRSRSAVNSRIYRERLAARTA